MSLGNRIAKLEKDAGGRAGPLLLIRTKAGENSSYSTAARTVQSVKNT